MTANIQNKNGYLYVVLTYSVNGKWKHKWISTGLKDRGNRNQLKKDLDKYIKEYEYLETGESLDDIFFIEYLKKWSEKIKNEIQVNSWEATNTNIRAHIIPYFEDKKLRLDEITPKIIADFYEYLSLHGNHKTGEGLSSTSIKKISSALKQCFRSALVIGLIDSNPAADIKVPKTNNEKAVKYVYMNKTDANKVIKAFDGHQLKPLVFMTLFYGLRRSEVIGLKWENVNFSANSFEIKSTIVRHRTLVEKDTTKTFDSNAVYEMLPQVSKILMSLKEGQEKNKKILGSAYNDTGYVFVWDDGRFFKPDYVSNEFKKVLKNAGLPAMRFHDLRHSTASILFDMGWDIEKIKCWLRHADIETTSNIYTHISKDRKKIMAQELEDLYEF